jgi:tetratricopeptide (TPR) repeat protein
MIASWRSARYLGRGQDAASAGHFEIALAHYQRAAELNSRDHGVYLHQALALAAHGHVEQALERLGTARRWFPEPAVHGLFMGQLLLDAGRSAEAQTVLAEAAGLAPDNLLIVAYRELARLESGAREEALRALRRHGLPENFTFQRRLALALERQLFLDLEPVTSTDPVPVAGVRPSYTRPDPPRPPTVRGSFSELVGQWWYRRRADALAARNDFRRALPLYEQAVARLPDDLDLLAFYAEALFHSGRYADCRALLLWRMEQVEALAASQPPWAALAGCLRAGLRMMTLGSLFAPVEGPGDIYEIPALGYIGRCHYHERAFVQARAWFDYADHREQALQGGVPWAENLYFRAVLMWHGGESAQAAALFRELERIEPALYQQRIRQLTRLALTQAESADATATAQDPSTCAASAAG